MRAKALKILDRLLGGVAVGLLPQPRKVVGGGGGTVLFIRPGGIGDAILLVPAIRALKERTPEVTIDVLAERRNGGGFALVEGVRTVLLYDHPKELLSAIRGKYDVVIDTEQWHRLSAVVARLAARGATVGYPTNERRRVFSHPVPYSQDEYEVDSFLRLLEPLGVPRSALPPSPFLDLPDVAVRRVGVLLETLGCRPYVTFFPGASIAERRWGRRNFADLARRVWKAGYGVVIVGGQEDRDDGAVIASAGAGLNLAGNCSLAESAAVIARSALLVSGDSGILHVGVGVGTPTVSLFGPGIAEKWAPRGERHVVLNKNLPCSPCTRFGCTPKCPIGGRCLQEITVDEVYAAVCDLLHRAVRDKS